MAPIDSLPRDQKAVLELVLRRGRTYDEIAEMLSIDRAGVRARALAALDALGPQSAISPERRALITDYLLGALPERIAEEVHDHLAQSAGERAWARVVASELEPIAVEPLPEIPGGGGGRARPVAAASAGDKPGPAREKWRREGRRARTERRPPSRGARERKRVEAAQTPAGRPTSRAGGAFLLGLGGAVVVAVVLVLVLSGGGGGGGKKNAAASQSTGTTPATTSTTGTSTTGTSTTGTSTTGTTATQVVAQINLNPPTGGSAKGIAEVLREAGRIGIAIVAQGLTPNKKHPPDAYAVWLYNSASDSHILGFVNPGVGTNGRLTTAGGLPSNAAHYGKLLVTLETQSNPHTPGAIVLEGALVGVP